MINSVTVCSCFSAMTDIKIIELYTVGNRLLKEEIIFYKNFGKHIQKSNEHLNYYSIFRFSFDKYDGQTDLIYEII